VIPARHRRSVGVGLLTVVLTLSACVGPATTIAAYEGKARRAAEDASSAVNTALLGVRIHQRGSLLENYFETMLSQAEDDISSVQTSFDSIQPPNSKSSDKLRDQLDNLLSDGISGISQLRFSARREDRPALDQAAAQLAPTAEDLTQFVESHGG
jgi:hypothetical protein